MRRVVCIACLCIAGCSFPDVAFDPLDATTSDAADTSVSEAAIVADAADSGADAEDGAALADASSETSDAADSSADASADSSASDSSAADGAADGGSPCDQDHDGYLAEGNPCGGNDCDDTDPNVHPNQGYVTFTPKPSNPLPGDFDCDGVVDKKLKHGVSCGLLTSNCASTYGFSDDPGCGVASNTYVTCADAIPGVSCKVGSTVTQTQACR